MAAAGTVYVDFESKNKSANNDQLIATAARYLGPKGIQGVLLLDGPELGSTRAFLASQLVTMKAIHVPQIDEDQYKIIHKQALCHSYLGSMGAYLRHLKPREFGSINIAYFDYMGSVEGNYAKGMFPLSDIGYWLSQTPQQKVVLAATFCCRSRKGRFDDRTCMEEQIDRDFLRPLLQWCRFRVKGQAIVNSYQRENIGRQSRGQKMVFLIYQLERDWSLQPIEVDFVIDSHRGGFAGYPDKLDYEPPNSEAPSDAMILC